MAATEVVEQSAGMPWFGWVALLVVVGFIGYRIYESRKNKPSGGGSGGGGSRPGGPKTHIK